MAKMNPENERAKRDYYDYLRHARRRSEDSVDAVATAIDRFEEANGHKAFKAFHIKQAVAFKTRLSETVSPATGKPLSRATVHAILAAVREFFIWLAGQPGYKARIAYGDPDYFNLTEKEVRVAKAVREKPSPTLEQIHYLIGQMPHGTDIEKRNRALVAFTLLTGARDGATVTFRLKHLDLAAGRLDQDAREVATKFSKTFSTWFFPVGGAALAIVTDWVARLRALNWGDDDPLFPATRIEVGSHGGFVSTGPDRKPWSTATPIRKVFREAFVAAGMPEFGPHSFRRTLAVLGERVCHTPEEFKAWSQNLGHEGVLTTFTSYGAVAEHRQADILRDLGRRETGGQGETAQDLLNRLGQMMRTVAQ